MMLMLLMMLGTTVDGFCCWHAPPGVDTCTGCTSMTKDGDWCHREDRCHQCNAAATWCSGGTPTDEPKEEPEEDEPEEEEEPEIPQPRGGPSAVAKYGHLAIKGTQLVSKETEIPVQLVGMSMFWSNNGWEGDKYWTREVVNELASWAGLNLIRCSVGVEDAGGYLDDPDGNKKKLLVMVNAAIEYGVYVLICWHSHDAEEHLSTAKKFFAQVAKDYKDVPNVLFAIYNEPEPTTQWSTVLNYANDVVPVIREHCDNIIIVGTPHWAQKPSLVDTRVTGINIMYGVHLYAAWKGHDKIQADMEIAIGNGLPLIVDEWGQGCPHILCQPDQTKVEWWFAFFNRYHLSSANWVLNDKQGGVDSTLSALQRGASVHGGWIDADMTEAGRSTKEIIARYAERFLDFHLLPVVTLTTWGSKTDLWNTDGTSVSVLDSTWKAFEVDVTVTSETRLSFIFQQHQQCRRHLIAVTDDNKRLWKATMFQLSGWNKWSKKTNVIFDFYEKKVQEDGKAYDIPLADYLSVGKQITYIAFMAHCNPNQYGKNDALFRNVALH